MTTATEAQIWDWLDQVPDPEIPVISVVDLGIVRGVAWAGDTLEVSVTPTYSGCPATSVIAIDIETALRDHGIEDIRIRTQRSPLDNRLAVTEGPGPARSLWHCAAATRRRARALPPLRSDRSGSREPVRLHPLQGALALQHLP